MCFDLWWGEVVRGRFLFWVAAWSWFFLVLHLCKFHLSSSSIKLSPFHDYFGMRWFYFCALTRLFQSFRCGAIFRYGKGRVFRCGMIFRCGMWFLHAISTLLLTAAFNPQTLCHFLKYKFWTKIKIPFSHVSNCVTSRLLKRSYFPSVVKVTSSKKVSSS